jgi:hypothetical protein
MVDAWRRIRVRFAFADESVTEFTAAKIFRLLAWQVSLNT